MEKRFFFEATRRFEARRLKARFGEVEIHAETPICNLDIAVAGSALTNARYVYSVDRPLLAANSHQPVQPSFYRLDISGPFFSSEIDPAGDVRSLAREARGRIESSRRTLR